MSEFVDILAEGDIRKSLVALRDLIAGQLEAGKHQPGCTCECDHPVAGDPRAVAALANQLRAVLADIAKLPDAEEEDPLDRVESAIADALHKVRADRQPNPEAPARP